jgi:hypothetical protein
MLYFPFGLCHAPIPPSLPSQEPTRFCSLPVVFLLDAWMGGVCEDPQFPEGRQTALKLPLALANTTKSSMRVNLLS